jgi:hypothetical protein
MPDYAAWEISSDNEIDSSVIPATSGLASVVIVVPPGCFQEEAERYGKIVPAEGETSPGHSAPAREALVLAFALLK